MVWGLGFVGWPDWGVGFVTVASFVELAKGFVHLQRYLAHERQRPPRTLR